MIIFLIIPLNSEFEDIYEAIQQAMSSSKAKLITVDEAFEQGDLTHLFHEIERADLIIADLTSLNGNAMYELGIAHKSNKPIITICRKGEEIPFDIVPLNIFYDRLRLQETLTKPLRNLLAHQNPISFIQKKNTEISKKRADSKTVFVSYSHEDTQYLNRLKVHMRPFEKKGLIDFWVDTKINAGEKWRDKIKHALDKSAIAILLISADFLASDFIIDNELPPLLKAAEEKGKVILPVILKPCRFTKDENLSKFQAINDPKTPLSKMDDNEREEIYVKIADYIDSLVRR